MSKVRTIKVEDDEITIDVSQFRSVSIVAGETTEINGQRTILDWVTKVAYNDGTAETFNEKFYFPLRDAWLNSLEYDDD